jgi:Tol biopolymer transport system component
LPSSDISPATVANVAIMDLATRQVRQLTDEKVSDRNWQVVGWMPDGKSLIANRIRIDFSEAGIWRIDVASGRAEAIFKERPNVVVIATSVSPDGELLAISSKRQPVKCAPASTTFSGPSPFTPTPGRILRSSRPTADHW